MRIPVLCVLAVLCIAAAPRLDAADTNGVAPALQNYGATRAALTNGSADAKQDIAGQRGKGTYVVHRGDTLATIAQVNHTTVRAIEAENGLTTRKLKVGQVLRIPPSTNHPASNQR